MLGQVREDLISVFFLDQVLLSESRPLWSQAAADPLGEVMPGLNHGYSSEGIGAPEMPHLPESHARILKLSN